MPVTGLRGRQIKDDDVTRADLNVTTSGSAVITRIIAGTNISITSTGVDTGTGDVTINATGGGSISGSGTASYLAKWVGTNQLGDSGVWEGTGYTDIRGIRFYEYANRPDTFTGDVFLVGDYTNPVAGKMFIGDGSGWRFHFSKRSAGGYLVPTRVGAVSSTTTSIDISGLGLQEGDVVIVAGYNDGAQPATPSTYTLGQGGFTNSVGYMWSYKVMGATPDTSVTGLTAGINIAVAYRNIDIANILDVTPPSVSTSTAGMPDCPSIDFVTTNSMIVAIGFLDDDVVASSVTAPSNYSLAIAAQYGSGGTGGTIMLADLSEEEIGVQNPNLFGGTGTDAWIGATIALRPLFSASAPLTTDLFSFRDSGQLRLSQYTSTTSFPGTAVGYLAFNSLGEVISVDAPSGGGISGSGTSGTIPIWTGSTALGDSVLTFASSRFNSTAGFTITSANSTTTGAGQIYLNGTGGNRIDWSTAGVAAPSLTTRSAGTKLVLYPNVGASTVDYALGIESDTLWFSTASIVGNFKWYSAASISMTLSGSNLMLGNIAASGKLTVRADVAGTSLYLTDVTNSTLIIQHPSAGVTRFLNGSSTIWLQESNNGNIALNHTNPVAKLSLAGGSLATTQVMGFSEGLTTGRLSTYDATTLLAIHSYLDATTFEISAGSTSGWVSGISITGRNATLHSATIKMYTYSAARLQIDGAGQLRFNNYTTTTSFTGTAVGVLAFTSDGSIITIATPGGGSGLTGSGTNNYIPKFTSGTSVGNSAIFDNGTDIGINTATPTTLTNYKTIDFVGGTAGALIRFSNSATTFLGEIYGSTTETAINAVGTFNLYVNSSQKFNVSPNEVNAYETIYARKLGAQIQIAGAVGTLSGIFQGGTNILSIADWATATNGLALDVGNGVMYTRSSLAGGGYIAFQRSGTTIYGYVGNSSLLFGAGYNATNAIGIRSEGDINFGTASGIATAKIASTGQLKLALYTTTTSFTGTAVGVLAFDASGNILTIATPGGGGGGGVGGSGTLNYIPKWNAGNSITDSQIFDNGSNVGIGTATPANITNYRTLHIQGGGSGAVLYFSTSDGTGRGYIYGSTAETAINCPIQFRVYVGATTKILSSSVGTGFGATTPAAMVDVVGSANFRNNDGNIMNTQGLSIVNVGTYTTFGANGGDVMMLGLQNTSAVNGGSVFRYQFGLYGDATGQELRISTVTTTSSIVGRFALKPNGQLRLDNYTSLSSFTGTKVGYLAFTSTGDIICDAGGGGTTEVITMYRIAFAAELANTWSNMPSTLQFFDSSSAFATRADLSTFNEVRLIVNKQGTAGANGSKLILRYQATSGAPFTQGSYSDIGTSELSVAVNVTNDILVTSWIPMATNAMDDVFVALLGEGGNGTADPVFGSIYAEFRYNPNIAN